MFRKKPTQWQENATVYPRLQQLAKKYLCIPGTSVPSERLFSKADELRHNSIDSSQNVNMIYFRTKTTSSTSYIVQGRRNIFQWGGGGSNVLRTQHLMSSTTINSQYYRNSYNSPK